MVVLGPQGMPTSEMMLCFRLSIDFLIINATCLSLRKYHPEPTVRSAPAAQMPAGPTSVARQPPTMAPWAQAAKAAPTPAPWAQTPQPPSPWNTSAALVPVAPAPAPAPAVQWLANQADDPWGTYEVPNQVRIQLFELREWRFSESCK